MVSKTNGIPIASGVGRSRAQRSTGIFLRAGGEGAEQKPVECCA